MIEYGILLNSNWEDLLIYQFPIFNAYIFAGLSHITIIVKLQFRINWIN